jgi:hypothetical protein
MRRDNVIACELGLDEVPFRRASWRSVREQVEFIERTRVPGGFRIVFRGPQRAVDAVESLVAAERECCSWAEWRVQAVGDRTVLQATAPETLIEELALAFGLGG